MSRPVEPKLEAAEVRENRALGSGYHLLSLEAPEVAARAAAGHFLMLAPAPETGPSFDPLLPRPFSFLARDPAAGQVQLFFRTVGRGTRLLAAQPPGTRLRALGPLGRPWPDVPAEPALLVAGGVGMPPILDLATELAARGRAVEVFYGGRGACDLHLLDRFRATRASLTLATDDGSQGWRGRVTEPLEARLADGATGCLYACGPTPMLRAVARLGERYALPTYVSLEAPMACGIGVCRGCAVPARLGDGSGHDAPQSYRMVCVDGPVFEAGEVAW
ncbi:MAG: dihydroorotate dehydrogenase electron transfer subunit [Deltaproteobacteria bacterium]|nr:MAG: dihydroorotate dehydrogenase electron transfer subunit [Deltaproteobacteria bacterium]